MRNHPKFLAAALIFSLVLPSFAPAGAIGIFQKINTSSLPVISVLVEKSLADSPTLSPKIDRYLVDVQKKLGASAVKIPVPKNVSVLDIFEGNADLYFTGAGKNAPLIGTILIGRVPIPVVDKNGNLFPSLFPFTDFDQPSYFWEAENSRFTFQTSDENPEIWHGVIRSPETDFEKRVEDLANFFDQNHAVHSQQTTFSPRIFLADFTDAAAFSAEQNVKYETWLENLEDLIYSRFSKHLLQKIADDQDEKLAQSAPDVDEILDEFDLNPLDFQIPDPKIPKNLASQVSDINSKFAIQAAAQRYVETFQNWLSLLNSKVDSLGHWDADAVDSVPRLLSEKDETAAIFIRFFNDVLERATTDALEQNLVPEFVAVSPSQTFETTDEEGNISSTSLPRYWLGNAHSSLTAEKCSIYRGSPRSDEHPTAQMVEANRTLNFDTLNDCSNYAGCCANNFQAPDRCQKFENTWSDVDTFEGPKKPIFDLRGTVEVSSGSTGAQGCESFLHWDFYAPPDPFHRFSSFFIHDEPRSETIENQLENFAAAALPIDRPRGVSFFDHAQSFQKINFLNFFELRQMVQNWRESGASESNISDLLTAEIQSQMESKISEINQIISAANAASEQRKESHFQLDWPGGSTAAPAPSTSVSIDPETGEEIETTMVTFCTFPKEILEHSENHHQILWSKICVSAEQGTLTQEQVDQQFPAPVGVGGAEEQFLSDYFFGTEIDEDLYESVVRKWGLEKLVDSLIWIDLGVASKRRQVFENALNFPDSNEFFQRSDFDGYEMIEIRASGDAESGFEIGQNLGAKDLDLEFEAAKSEILQSEFQDFDRSSTDLTAPEKRYFARGDAGELRSFESGDKNRLDVPTQIVASAKTFFPFFRDTTPIEVEILVQNYLGQTIDSDFETEIFLDADSRFSNFFLISPAPSARARGGRARFTFTPKKNGANQNFSLSFRSDLPAISPVQVSISPLENRIFPTFSAAEILAADSEGVEISIKILDGRREISRDFDGETLRLSSAWGRFESSEVLIENGSARARFLPGQKSGRAEILISSPENSVAPAKKFVQILPRNTSGVRSSLPKKLVAGSSPVSLSFSSVDRFGNETEIAEDFEISSENLNFFDAQNTPIEAPKKGNFAQTFRVGAAGKGEGVLNISGENFGESFGFSVVESPQLSAQISDESSIAGSGKNGRVLVQSKDKNGRILDGDFEIYLDATPPNLLKIPEKISLKNGVGSFDFLPQNVAGTARISVRSSGFFPTEVSHQVRPESAEKLAMIADGQNFSVDENEFLVDVFALDQFGNRDSGFSGSVKIRPTEQTADLVQNIEPNPVRVRSGKGTAKVSFAPSAGEIHLIASAENLVSAAESVEISDFFAPEKFDSISPKSIFTLLAGTNGKGVFGSDSLATKMLASGQTQAIATQIADSAPDQMLGWIGGEGDFAQNLLPEILSGVAPEIDFFSDSNLLARARISFASEPEISVAKNLETGGVFVQKILGDFDFDPSSRTGFFQKSPIFSFQKFGGIEIADSRVRLAIDQNFLNWNVFFQNKIIAQIQFRPETTAPISVQNYSRRNGILVKTADENIYASPTFTANSTEGEIGLGIFSRTQKASASQKPGRRAVSIENALDSPTVLWHSDFKPAALFAAGNSIGDSTRAGSSDAFLLIGDPSLSVVSESPTEFAGQKRNTKDELVDLYLSENTGQLIFSAPDSIREILAANLNDDDLPDLLVRAGKNIFAILGGSENRFLFESSGAILRSAQAVRATGVLDFGRGESDILELFENGKITRHRNTGQSFVRENLEFAEISSEIIDFKVAKLNKDDFPDLVISDSANGIWVAGGRKNTDFLPAQKVFDFGQKFDPISETSDPAKPQKIRDFSFLGSLFFTHSNIENDAQNDSNLQPFLGSENLFLPAPASKSIYSQLDLKPKKAGKIVPESKISAQISVWSPTEIPDFSFRFLSEKFSLDPDSIVCTGCVREFSVGEKSENTAVSISEIFLPARGKIMFSFDLLVNEIEPISFLVGDFESGADEIDDIWASQKEGDETRIFKFLSSSAGTEIFGETEKNISKIPHQLVRETLAADGGQTLLDSIENIPPDAEIRSHFRDLFSAPKGGSIQILDPENLETDDSISAQISDEFHFFPAAFASESSAETLPENPGNLSEHLSGFSCGGGDGCSSVPISMAFLGPGHSFLSDPPFADLDSNPEAGSPMPRMWISPKDPWKKSGLRNYSVVTNTGQTADALCTGDYQSSIEMGAKCTGFDIGGSCALSPSNCLVSIPAGGQISSVCPAPRDVSQKVAAASSESSGSLFSTLDPSEPAQTDPAFAPEIQYSHLLGASVLTQELQKVYLSLFALMSRAPNISVILPDSMSFFDDFALPSSETLLARDREAISIPFPVISPEKIERFKIAADNRKREFKIWQRDSSRVLDQFKEEVRDFCAERDSFARFSITPAEQQFRCQVAQTQIDHFEKTLLQSENVATQIDTHLLALQTYHQNLVVKMQEVQTFVDSAPEKIDSALQEMHQSVDDWHAEIEDSIKKWQRYQQKLQKLVKSWESIPAEFNRFSDNCSVCNVNRGTAAEFLVRLFVGKGAKNLADSIISKIEAAFPETPDLIFDASDLAFGMHVRLPRVESQEIELALFDLPEVPAVPKVPNMSAREFSTDPVAGEILVFSLPVLDESAEISLNLPDFAPVIPAFPSVDDPPNPPNIFGELSQILALGKVAFSSVCPYLSGGGFVVPEWYVKGIVEQMTNRSELFGSDYNSAARLDAPQIPPKKTVVHHLPFDFAQPIYEAENSIKSLSRYQSCMIGQISAATKTNRASSKITRNYEQKIAQILGKKGSNFPENAEDSPDFSPCLFEVENAEEATWQRTISESGGVKKVALFAPDLKRFSRAKLNPNFKNLRAKKSDFARLLRPKTKNWLAAQNEFLPDYSADDLEALAGENANFDPPPQKGIFFSAPNGQMLKLFKIPARSGAKVLSADLNNDGISEVLYSNGADLFLKTLYFDPEESDEVPEKISEIKWVDFASKVAPATQIKFSQNTTGSEIRFSPAENVNYFHWNFAETFGGAPKNFLQKTGLLLRERAENFQIRPAAARVKKVRGNPIFWSKSSESLPNFSEKECENSEVLKPFFSPRTQLLAAADSRMVVRIPPHPNDPESEEIKEFYLRAGEEVWVEQAEVCATRGEILAVSSQSLQKKSIKKSDFFLPKSRLELGKKDGVELEFFDGSRVEISETAKYDFHILPRQKTVRFFATLPHRNFYGSLRGFFGANQTFAHSRFLHDPQVADDRIPPQIRIQKGEKRTEPLFQKITIDATDSFDNFGIEQVWWDFDPRRDSDGDGNPENDNDFPSPNPEKNYSVAETLKIELPAQKSPRKFEINLNVADRAGNRSAEKVSLQIFAPTAKILDASVRGESILGALSGKFENIELSLLRLRNGVLTKLPRIARSDASGQFVFSGLSANGGMEIFDRQNEKTVARISPNGAVEITDDRFRTSAEFATDSRPSGVAIRDQKNEIIAVVSYSPKNPADVQVVETLPTGDSDSGVFFRDENPTDRFLLQRFGGEFLSFSGAAALVDSAQNRTLGVLTPDGNFYATTPNQISLQTKNETDRPVFEILGSSGQVLAAFSIGFELQVWMSQLEGW